MIIRTITTIFLLLISVTAQAHLLPKQNATMKIVDDTANFVVSVPASNLPAFRSWVLGLLDHAVVLEPVDVRAHIVTWLAAVAAGEGFPPRGSGPRGPRGR